MKTKSYKNLFQEDSVVLAALREDMPIKLVANDTLYAELEARYGGAFAQWVIDGMDRRQKEANNA